MSAVTSVSTCHRLISLLYIDLDDHVTSVTAVTLDITRYKMAICTSSGLKAKMLSQLSHYVSNSIHHNELCV